MTRDVILSQSSFFIVRCVYKSNISHHQKTNMSLQHGCTITTKHKKCWIELHNTSFTCRIPCLDILIGILYRIVQLQEDYFKVNIIINLNPEVKLSFTTLLCFKLLKLRKQCMRR